MADLFCLAATTKPELNPSLSIGFINIHIRRRFLWVAGRFIDISRTKNSHLAPPVGELCYFHFGNAASRCVTQRTLLILPEDFYLTNTYNILGDLVVETKLGLLGLWHVFG